MKEWIYEFSHTIYAKFLIGGLVGSVIDRLRNKATLGRTLANGVIAMFVGLVSGVMITNYLELSNDVTFALVSLCGNFSRHLLYEAEKIIGLASVFVKMRLKK